jgi:signal peptidase II
VTELNPGAATGPSARVLIALAGFAFVADAATKSMAKALLAHREPVNLLPGVDLTLGFNRGISFGLFPTESFAAAVMMITAQITIVTGLAIWMWRATDLFTRTGLALVVGGAGGNIADRIRFGAVTDFIDLYVGDWHWPAFNAADTFIVLGVACLVVSNILASRSARPAEQRGAV